MITTRQEILTNTVITADLTYARMENGEAEKYAEVLKQNTSIENLIMSRCSITDEEFALLAKALLERNLELTILDLDYNYLTPASFNILKELIEKQLVIHLCIHRNDKLIKDSNCQREFAKLAADNKMGIYISNPLVREDKYPCIFGAIQPQIPRGNNDLHSLTETINTLEKHHYKLKEKTEDTTPKPGFGY